MKIEDLLKIKECLEDWIRSTGFGETNRRDRAALKIIQEEIRQDHDKLHSLGVWILVDEEYAYAAYKTLEEAGAARGEFDTIRYIPWGKGKANG